MRYGGWYRTAAAAGGGRRTPSHALDCAPMSRPILPDDPPPAEPLPPDESACCGSGCDPCVWDFFNDERRQWQAEMAAWQARQAGRGTPPGADAA